MQQLQLDEATAARRRIPFRLVDATDGDTEETAITVTPSTEILITKNNSTETAGAGTVTEIGNGNYYYEATAGEVDTVGFLLGRIADASSRNFVFVVQVVAFDPYSASLGMTTFDPATDTVKAAAAPIPVVSAGYVGDFREDEEITFFFNTVDKDGALITLAGTPTIQLHKADGVTETTSGATLTVDFDSDTGRHLVTIPGTDAWFDTSTNYSVSLSAGTVDGVSVVGWNVGEFSIENRTVPSSAVQSMKTVVLGTVDASPTPSTTTFADATLDSTDDHYNGRHVIFVTGVLANQETDITDYTGATGLITVTAMTEAPTAGDTFVIV